MRQHQVSARSLTWWVQSQFVRKWGVPLVLLYAAIVLILTVWDALDGSTNLVWTAIGSLLVAAAAVLWARSRTRVSREGIEIFEVRTRMYGWTEIADVCAAPRGGYAIKVQLELVSGRRVTLPGVTPRDRDDLVRFRLAPPERGESGE